MSDRPDYTLAANVQAQIINQLAVDIVAQTLANLKVNIAAQDLAKVAIDIASQSLSALGINITAQDLSQLVIKIAAQSVGVYLQPDWAATQGTDKFFTGGKSNATFMQYGEVLYTVTSGKNLFIVQLWARCVAHNSPDADLNQMCSVDISDTTLGTTPFSEGGHGGFNCAPNVPIVFPAGHAVHGIVQSWCDHPVDLQFSFSGYEV